MTFASFSTIIAVFENLVGSAVDNYGWSRIKSVLINGVVILLGSIPSILGYNAIKNVHLIGGRDILDSADFIVSNILLPSGSLVFLLFCVTKFGWGADKFLDEANAGKGIKISRRMTGYFKYVLPVLILLIFISGFME